MEYKAEIWTLIRSEKCIFIYLLWSIWQISHIWHELIKIEYIENNIFFSSTAIFAGNNFCCYILYLKWFTIGKAWKYSINLSVAPKHHVGHHVMIAVISKHSFSQLYHFNSQFFIQSIFFQLIIYPLYLYFCPKTNKSMYPSKSMQTSSSQNIFIKCSILKFQMRKKETEPCDSNSISNESNLNNTKMTTTTNNENATNQTKPTIATHDSTTQTTCKQDLFTVVSIFPPNMIFTFFSRRIWYRPFIVISSIHSNIVQSNQIRCSKIAHDSIKFVIINCC